MFDQNKLFLRQNQLIAYHFVIHQTEPSYRRIPIAFKIRNNPPGGKISIFVRSYPYEPEENIDQNPHTLNLLLFIKYEIIVKYLTVM